MNLYQQSGSSNLVGCQLEVGVASWFIQHDKVNRDSNVILISISQDNNRKDFNQGKVFNFQTLCICMYLENQTLLVEFLLVFTRETTFVTSFFCFPACQSSSEKGLLLKESKFFLLTQIPFRRKQNNFDSCLLAGLGGAVGCAIRLETRRSRVQTRPRSATFFQGDSLPSADSRRAVDSFWRKNVHSTG